MLHHRRLVGVFGGVMIWIADVAPRAANCTAPVPFAPGPDSQNVVPSTEVAPRTLLPSNAPTICVLVSTAPLRSTRATVRGATALVVPAIPVVPSLAK